MAGANTEHSTEIWLLVKADSHSGTESQKEIGGHREIDARRVTKILVSRPGHFRWCARAQLPSIVPKTGGEAMPRALLIVLFIITCIFVAMRCFAQDAATGAIRGTVLDPSGSRIAQASVVAVSAATGARYSAASDGEGHFVLDLLPPGYYTARAVAQGMSAQVTPTLHVEVGAAAEIVF